MRRLLPSEPSHEGNTSTQAELRVDVVQISLGVVEPQSPIAHRREIPGSAEQGETCIIL